MKKPPENHRGSNEISAGKYILRAVQSQKVTFFRSIVWGGTHTTNINHSR